MPAKKRLRTRRDSKARANKLWKAGRKKSARQMWGRIGARKKKALKRKRLLPPPTKLMWRITVAINYVHHHVYRAIRLQRWATTREELLNMETELVEKVRDTLEQKLGFSEDDWWFPYQVGVGYQQVPYDPSLIGTEEMEDEFLREKKQ